MKEYKMLFRLKQLNKRKETIIKSLEWAISNNDRGLEKVCEIELKAILKETNKINKKLGKTIN